MGGAMFSTDEKCSKETWSIVTEFALSARTTSLCNLILHVNINCKGFFGRCHNVIECVVFLL